MTFGSLFAGLGGFDLAFERAGMRPAWQVEIDQDCGRVLERHWPDMKRRTDIKRVKAKELEPVDVICFGSPCQDFSVAGKRAGLKGERSGLFREAMRLVRQLRPAFAVFENVPGILSSHGGRDFFACLRAFRQCGARELAWRILDARHWGVAQRRRRVFLVADFRGERAGQILFETEGCSRNPAAGGEAGAGLAPSVTPGARRASGQRSGEQLTVATLTSNGDAHSGFRLGDGLTVAEAYQCHGSNVGPMGTVRSGNGHTTGGVPFLAFGGNDTRGPLDVATAVNACGTASGRQDFESETFIVNAAESCAKQSHARRSDTARCLDQTGGFAANQGGTVAVIPISADAAGGRSGNAETPSRDTAGLVRLRPPSLGIGDAGDDSFTLAAATPPAVAFHENQRHEITTSDTAGSLKVGGGKPGQGYPAVAEGMTVRRLTPTECLRLQGLPDGWLDLDPPLSDSAKYRLIGNSVAVPVVEWIGRRLMEAAA